MSGFFDWSITKKKMPSNFKHSQNIVILQSSPLGYYCIQVTRGKLWEKRTGASAQCYWEHKGEFEEHHKNTIENIKCPNNKKNKFSSLSPSHFQSKGEKQLESLGWILLHHLILAQVELLFLIVVGHLVLSLCLLARYRFLGEYNFRAKKMR